MMMIALTYGKKSKQSARDCCRIAHPKRRSFGALTTSVSCFAGGRVARPPLTVPMSHVAGFELSLEIMLRSPDGSDRRGVHLDALPIGRP